MTKNTQKKSNLGMVASLAGVSPSTVSRILNSTAKVSEAKQLAVNNAIARLNFRPNPAARSLAGGKTMSIGILTQFIDSPYYGEALRGIEDILQEQNYLPLFTSGHWNEPEERERLASLTERKVDGIIVLSGRLSDQFLRKIAENIPLVVIGRNIKGKNLYSLEMDNYEGSRLATRYLISLGHRNIAYISGPLDHQDSLQRLEGFKAELKAKKINLETSLIIEGDFREAGGYKAADQLLQTGKIFSAIITANDQMAYGVQLALHNAGMRIPDDVSLVGFDDLPHSAFTVPPLTTVKQSVYEVGVLAARTIVSILNKSPLVTAPIRAALVTRQSTRSARV